MIAFTTVSQSAWPSISPQSSGWKQACLSCSRGGLGLRSVAVHSTAAYLGSVSSSSPDLASSHYVIDALNLFNLQVSAEDTVSIPLPTKSHFQHDLSQRIENCQFHALYNSGSLADRARLLSISSAHGFRWSPPLGKAATWLQAKCSGASKGGLVYLYNT